MNATNKTPTQAELITARDFIADLIRKLEADRDLVGRQLNASALDGTPYAVVVIQGGHELVAGHWPDFKSGARKLGFLHLSAIPAGLSGAFFHSATHAAEKVEQLRDKGEAAVSIHRRELERRQLERIENDLRAFRGTLEKIVAQLNAPIEVF